MDIYHVQHVAYPLQDPSYWQGSHAEDMLKHADGISAKGEDSCERGPVFTTGHAPDQPPAPTLGMLMLYDQ